jgi:hypothetical protein
MDYECHECGTGCRWCPDCGAPRSPIARIADALERIADALESDGLRRPNGMAAVMCAAERAWPDGPPVVRHRGEEE